MKQFDIAKYLRENYEGPFKTFQSYADLKPLKEDDDLGQQEAMPEPYEGDGHPIDGLGGKLNRHMDVSMNEADGSFDVRFSYNDYPSITDRYQQRSVKKLINLVNSLGGNAEVTKDEFDGVDLKVTGISSFDELKAAYDKVVEDDELSILGSWVISPKEEGEMNEENTEEEMHFNDEIAMLSQEYIKWLEQNNLPKMSADELLADLSIEKTDEQKAWLQTFINRWEDAMDADNIDEEVSVSSSGVEMEEEMDGADHDTRFDDLGGKQIKSAIKSLMDSGFDSREIAQFVVDTIRSFKK